MLKNVYDAKAPTRNLVTTITGIVTLIITLLVTFGVLTPEQADNTTTQVNVLATAIPQIISAIAALILIFKAKD
jgi:amino acid transporter